jgi:ferredoxin-nitrite reductase
VPNKFEEIKSAKHPLDIYPDILRYAALGPDGWRAITDDDKERLKWFGVFFRKPTPGHFMMRIRMPGGIATAAQVRELAAITRDYGRDVIDVTTRQQVQLRWMTIADVPDILERLHRVGLTSMQTGLDNSRNVVGCSLAGLTPHELFDATSQVRRYHDLLLADRVYANLPRKFNVTITGCLENCSHAETQDVGLTPAVREEDGREIPGFNVRVGGKMGSGGMVPGWPLDAFVPFEEGGQLSADVTRLFALFGARETRSRARMHFLVADWGIERFRSELEALRGAPLLPAGRDVRRRHRTDHLGVTQLKEAGRYAVGLCVPIGRTGAAQFEELARLAETYGTGEVRFTIEQNVILPGIPDWKLPALLAEPLLEELRPDPSHAMRGTVSCIGVDYCNLALAETKGAARDVVRHLEAVMAPAEGRPVTMNWSGCPAACGNHQAADVGFLGGKARVGGQVVETFDVFAGGRTGTDPAPAQKVLEKVPADRIATVAERLVRAHGDGRSLRDEAAIIAAELHAADSETTPKVEAKQPVLVG